MPACPGCAALEAQLATVEAVLADEQRNVRLETEAHDRTRARMREIEAERAALEADVRRLETNAVNISRAWNEAVSERDAKAALLAELVAAARAFLDRDRLEGGYESWNQALSDLRDAVARAEAEAGGKG